MRIELVSLDLDGTLVDTAGEIAEAANRALAEHGLPVQPVPALRSFIGHGAHALMRRVLAGLAADPPVDTQAVLASFDRHYAQTTGTLGRPYPGAQAALDALRVGGLKLACVTNKELRHTRRLLEVHGWRTAFDLVIGGDSLACSKPDGEVLRHVTRTLGVATARTAHVGDSATDVQAARNAGVTAWAVPYGYNAGEPIECARPDRIFDSLLHMADHVLALRAAGFSTPA
jgi:phosphoglycolate phosphatase